MNLERCQDGGTTTLRVAGDVDVRTGPQLRETGEKELAQSSCKSLVVDLSEVEFVDSTGLGMLLALRAAADELGKRLVLRSPSEAIFYVMDLAGLKDDFEIEDG